jgi:hypothetical protein
MATLAIDIERPTLLDEPGGATLEDLVCGAWAALGAGAPAACPACGERLVPRHGSGAQPVAGRCTGCGSELS